MPAYALTGANRGLGLEFVRQLSGSSTQNTIFAGVRSVHSDLSDLMSLAKPSKIHILECDTASVSRIQFLASEVSSLLGKFAKLDYLLNNAGISSVPHQTSLSIGPEDLTEHITVNVLGPAKLVEYLRPHLHRKSVVMNMASGLGSVEGSKGMQPRKCRTYSIS
ncbi:hypothetical protein MMC13_004997 [Lambiella insularis]|nr:hypothetical protein [Lambiella insularis]